MVTDFAHKIHGYLTNRTYATGTGDSEALLQADRYAELASVCSNR